MSLAAASGMTMRATVRKTKKSPLVIRLSSHGDNPTIILTTGGNSYLQINKNEHIAPRV